MNINVKTRIHRDDLDGGWCLDFVITDDDFEGGELVLAQPGIIIPLCNGDFSVFPSMNTDHFNLDYRGIRSSFVFQTDKEFEQWEKTRHHWIGNQYMT